MKWFKICLFALLGYFALFAGVMLLVPHPEPMSPAEVAAMKTKNASRGNASREPKEDSWDPAKAKAHPKAVKLLQENFCWDIADEDTPFGNDEGWDAAAGYHRWMKLHPVSPVMTYLEGTASKWEAPLWRWRLLTPNLFSAFPSGDGYILQTADQMIIGTAFTQLVSEGRIDVDLQTAAARAINNEQSPFMLAHWLCAVERKQRMQKMLRAIAGANE